MLAVVEELLAGDLVVLVDRVDGDFRERDALARSLGRDIESKVDGELIGAVEVRAENLFPVKGFVGDPVFGFLNDRLLADGFLAARSRAVPALRLARFDKRGHY